MQKRASEQVQNIHEKESILSKKGDGFTKVSIPIASSNNGYTRFVKGKAVLYSRQNERTRLKRILQP